MGSRQARGPHTCPEEFYEEVYSIVLGRYLPGKVLTYGAIARMIRGVPVMRGSSGEPCGALRPDAVSPATAR